MENQYDAVFQWFREAPSQISKMYVDKLNNVAAPITPNRLQNNYQIPPHIYCPIFGNFLEGLKNVQLEVEDYQIAKNLVSEIGCFSGKEADLVCAFQKITENYFLNSKIVAEPIRSKANQNSETRTDLSLIKDNYMLLNFEAKMIETGIIIIIIIFIFVNSFFFFFKFWRKEMEILLFKIFHTMSNIG